MRRNLNLEKVNAIQEQLKSNSLSGFSYMKNLPSFKDGETRYLRVVPHIDFAKHVLENFDEDKPFTGEGVPFKSVWVHGSKSYVIPCPKKINPSNRCAFCENAEKYKDNPDSIIAKSAKKNFPSMKLLSYVLWRDSGEAPTELFKWMMSSKTGKSLIGIYSNNEYSDGIEDPFEGVDLAVTRSGTDFDTEYEIIPKRKSSYIFSAEFMEKGVPGIEFDLDTYREMVESLPNIDEEFTTIFTYEETLALLRGELTVGDIFKLRKENGDDSSTPSESEVEDDEIVVEEPVVIRRVRRSVN